MSESEPARPPRPPWRALLGLAAVWAVLFLPHLGTPELDDEEGRRLLPARAMLATGDQVVPRIFERPYLSKPPLAFWAIELAALPAGGVPSDPAGGAPREPAGGVSREPAGGVPREPAGGVSREPAGGVPREIGTWALRLPSALAVLGVAATLYLFARRRLGERAAVCGAGVWLVTPLAIEKGLLGELEAPLALFVTLALVALFAAREPEARGRRRVVLTALGGLALGAAVLTKGPAAWVFLGAGAAAGVAVDRRRAGATLLPALAMVALSAVALGAWVALLARELGVAELQAVWGRQMVGGERSLGEYLDERWTYAVRAAGGLLPGSALLAGIVPRLRRGQAPEAVRAALLVLAVAAAFFLVYPRSQARYLFPAAPWCALAGGFVLAEGLGAARRAAEARALRGLAYVLGGFGLALAAAAAVDRFARDLAAPEPDALGLALGLGAAAAGAAAIRWARADRRRAALGAALAVALAARLFHATQVVAQEPPERRPLAAAIEGALPAGTPLYTARWGHFNLLAYVPRRVVWTDAPSAVPPGAPLLFATRGATGPPAGVGAWERLGAWDAERGWRLVVVRAPASR